MISKLLGNQNLHMNYNFIWTDAEAKELYSQPSQTGHKTITKQHKDDPMTTCPDTGKVFAKCNWVKHNLLDLNPSPFIKAKDKKNNKVKKRILPVVNREFSCWTGFCKTSCHPALIHTSFGTYY